MDQTKREQILDLFKSWWRNEFAKSHQNNTLKLTKIDEFSINPLLWSYLANYFQGNNNPETLAKVLIYPRVLGTSVVTSFGVGFQKFIVQIFKDVSGSQIPGIDLEFIDQTDGRLKYCQLKSGPSVINYDDVNTISEHFKSAQRRARINHLDVHNSDYMFCLLYGEKWQKSGNIKLIEKDYKVVIGAEFWHRFTGDKDFYKHLIQSVGEIAQEYNMKNKINQVIKKLAKDIQNKYPYTD